MKNKIVLVAIVLFCYSFTVSAQNPQLCYNSNGSYYYDCSEQKTVRKVSSSDRTSGNSSSTNNITVYAGNNSNVVINNQTQPATNGVTPRQRNSVGASLCYNPSGNYYYDCSSENYDRRVVSNYPTSPVQVSWQNQSPQVIQQPNQVWYTDRGTYIPQQNQQVYYPNNSGVYSNGYYPAVPVNQNPGYYGNSGYYNQPAPTPYWHEQKSSSVVHDIQTNAGNPGMWWGSGGFSPRNINVNYRVRIQQNKTSVRGSTVNGQVPYVYNTGYGW